MKDVKSHLHSVAEEGPAQDLLCGSLTCLRYSSVLVLESFIVFFSEVAGVTAALALTVILTIIDGSDSILSFLCSLVRGCRPGKIVQMSEAEVRGLCIKSREIFLSQPILLELEAPLKICGQCFPFVF